MRSDADQLQADLESLNEASGALFKIRRRPAHDARRPASCAATRSTSCRSCSTCVLGQMSLVGPRPLPQRDFEQLEEWHKKRYLVLPGHHRPVAGLGPLGARLRRPRAARLPLPRALVGRARPHDPAQDDPGGAQPPGRLLSPLLVLVRHGESTWNAERRLQGQLDPPLSEAGRAQARALAPLVARLGVRRPGASSAPISGGRARPRSCSASRPRA